MSQNDRDGDVNLGLLDPRLGRTTSARQFRKLAGLLVQDNATRGRLAHARAWLPYARLDDTAARKALADACFEMGLFEEAAQHYREVVRQYESATT